MKHNANDSDTVKNRKKQTVAKGQTASSLRMERVSKRCRKKLLLAGFMMAPLFPAIAQNTEQAATKNEAVSIETLEQEIRHIEQAQAALQQDLLAVRQQLLAKNNSNRL